jgi:hypothetical protein
MKVKVSVTGLSDNPSKQEEIDILFQLHKLFEGRQWYVSSLFSEDLVTWFSHQVSQDVNCDVMLELSGSREHALKAEGIIRNMTAALEVQAKEHDRKLSKVRDGYEAEIKHLKQELQFSKEREAEYADGLEKEKEQCIEADRVIRQNRTTIDFLEAEIIRLKAKLYDLTEKMAKEDKLQPAPEEVSQ